MLTTPVAFASEDASHQQSLVTLNELEKYSDFMRSIDTMCDVGCGTGLDLEWWATRSILDDNENSISLDITCTGIDQLETLSVAKQYDNISYQRGDFEEPPIRKKAFDVLWCHDAFQYAINPLQTLKYFNEMLTPGGMLAIIVPQTTNLVYHKQEFDQMNFQYYNYTLVSLIHMLALSGFDCKSGFFLKKMEDPWINAVVYKSQTKAMDPCTTTWFDLMAADLLPESVESSIKKCGHVRQQDLVLPWLNKSYIDYSK